MHTGYNSAGDIDGNCSLFRNTKIYFAHRYCTFTDTSFNTVVIHDKEFAIHSKHITQWLPKHVDGYDLLGF